MKRNFCIGSEWLYYKIYAGIKTSDLLLAEKLQPIIEDLKVEGIIDKWFFIRYKDPSEHIRIRFYNNKIANLSVVIARLYPVLNELLEQDVIWKVQTDTYQREIERYGEHTMEDSETIFWHDSELIIKYLDLKDSFIQEETQLLFSFLAIDRFLNSFLTSNTEKLEIMDVLQSSFKKEFDADKNLRKEMDKYFRRFEGDINDFLDGVVKNEFPEIFEAIQEKQNQIDKAVVSIKENLTISLPEFLMSHIHMMINRQYNSRQRMYEALLYDQLHRYYKTKEFSRSI
ncbi:thiopeptide-type bacteriocin biosynthesis protein [Flavobacterium sp.]|uniref:thiopeptide-type bacteriocin biosynthesis protein n=1 Tax=Flavobacterium sp. TaxID=239 RepID=UPI00262E597E|nr:thiopeptide-type bacteriocin biosynthesis protein [Flavobacterium sp.]